MHKIVEMAGPTDDDTFPKIINFYLAFSERCRRLNI